jgi:hypothetical protein
MDGSQFLTVTETAEALGVTPRHARRLADSGALTRIARGIIDRESVDRYLVSQRQSRTRSWSEPTAWGAAALLSGGAPDWMGNTQTSRLRHSLRDISSADELITRMRGRSRVQTFDAHRAALPRLRGLIAMSDQHQLGLSGISGDVADGYIDGNQIREIVRGLGLRPAVHGNVTLRAVTFDVGRVQSLVTTRVVAALDAAVSIDPRTRGVGEQALEEILEVLA